MSELHTFGFYFGLSFSSQPENGAIVFKEVSGILMKMETDEISVDGNNSFKHHLPTSSKYSNLVLKQGLASKDSDIIEWCRNTFSNQEDSIKVKNIVLKLWAAEGKLLKSWSFINAYPVKWSVSEINPAKDNIMIESLEFAYSYFQ